MNREEELKKIKKMYGEKFMHLCRRLFPTILEQEGVLLDILSSSFATNSETLAEDIENNRLENELKSYIYDKANLQQEEIEIETDKTPYELLDELGYDLYECKTEKDIQKFKKYYASGEELCTFEGGRLDECVVFFAVRKNVDKIKRENFENPQRQDEYGTSVMSIQFYKKGTCTVSIKNRYNHTVANPDATFGNNLDRIVPGLSSGFENLLKKEYQLELNKSNREKFYIPRYTVANDGKYYKYNMEEYGKYYCPGNIVIKGGQVHKVGNPESIILMDYFVLDIPNKTIGTYSSGLQDSFVNSLKGLKNLVIKRERNKENNTTIIKIENKEKDKEKEAPIIIELNEDNQIIGYKNEELEKVGDNFLRRNTCLRYLELPKLKEVGSNFLPRNKVLRQLKLPLLEVVGEDFLMSVTDCEVEFPNLKSVGGFFLIENNITRLELPQLQYSDRYFLHDNRKLCELYLPNIQEIGNGFLVRNTDLRILDLPNLKVIGRDCLRENKSLTYVRLPNIQYIEEEKNFNGLNKLTYIEMPKFPWIERQYERIIERNLRKLEAKDILKLDIDEELTTSELGNVHSILRKIKEKFVSVINNGI